MKRAFLSLENLKKRNLKKRVVKVDREGAKGKKKNN